MIVLITPTGGRPRQFQLCCNWMRKQTYKGKILWIIVDDCYPMTTDDVGKFPDNWTIIKNYPRPAWKSGMNTQGRNLQAGLNIVKHLEPKDIHAIFIIEDDDYYKPIYLDQMMARIKVGNFNAYGETNTVYYHIPGKRYLVSHNDKHSSLFQTAFKPSVIPIFETCLGEKFIDIRFFRNCPNTSLFKAGNLAIGIKGLPGRSGIGHGHDIRNTRMPDRDLSKLKELIGNDYKYYA